MTVWRTVTLLSDFTAVTDKRGVQRNLMQCGAIKLWGTLYIYWKTPTSKSLKSRLHTLRCCKSTCHAVL